MLWRNLSLCLPFALFLWSLSVVIKSKACFSLNHVHFIMQHVHCGILSSLLPAQKALDWISIPLSHAHSYLRCLQCPVFFTVLDASAWFSRNYPHYQCPLQTNDERCKKKKKKRLAMSIDNISKQCSILICLLKNCHICYLSPPYSLHCSQRSYFCCIRCSCLVHVCLLSSSHIYNSQSIKWNHRQVCM